jgi:glutamine---fructose-6-phosphate transaminase (isomerizing)
VAFDPRQPLPDAPVPWVPSTMPPARRRPPYVMTDMIAAEPALAERLASRLAEDAQLAALAAALRSAAAEGRPIVTTGCGTSEHAAMAMAFILDEALDLPPGRGAQAVQALEMLHAPLADGLLIAVSHEGGTWATIEALRAARNAGAQTALVTVSDRSPGAALASIVVTTQEQDQSWCHTVGYLSPLVVACVAADLLTGRPTDAHQVGALLVQSADDRRATAVANRLALCSRTITTGSGIDYVAARELALKIEEGARLPAVAHQLETVRHGHLAAADETTALVIIATAGAGRIDAVMNRTEALLRSAAALRMTVAGIVDTEGEAGLDHSLTPAGRLVTPATAQLPDAAGAALTSAIALQLLAERLAGARGVNPDTLGREEPRQAAAHE